MITLSTTEQKRLTVLVSIVLAILALLLFVKFASVAKAYRYIGAGTNTATTISVSGTGEIFAVPDIATINFTVRGSGQDLKTAHDKVIEIVDQALAKTKELGIEEKDTKTINDSGNPVYDYGRPCYVYPCSSTQNKITSYEWVETIELKIRNTDGTGAVSEALSALGVTEIQGPNFTIDDPEKVNNDARDMAIENAKEKADILAKSLGVKLVRIVNFSEDGNYGPYYYEKAVMMDGATTNQASTVPVGQNQITSNVTITYEIR